MASRAKFYLSGVDTLILNAKIATETIEPSKQQEVPGRVEQMLSEWLTIAKQQEEHYETTWKHEGRVLTLELSGTQHYRYLLTNKLIDLMIGPRLCNGAPVRVRFQSEYLWRRGIDAAVVNTHAFLMEILDEYLYLQVARIDLCADVIGLDIPRVYERVFLCRARKERVIEKAPPDRSVRFDHRLETLQFSGHGSPMSARIYDKIAEIEGRGGEKRWFYDLWKMHGWDGSLPQKSKQKDAYSLPVQDTKGKVLRVECELQREALREMDIDEVYNAIERIPALWAYCVGHVGVLDGWLRMVVPNRRDSNRARWKTAPAWQVVQQAFSREWRGYADMEDIQRERKRQVNLDRAEKAMAGYYTTYGAWLQDDLDPHDDVTIVMQRVLGKMLKHWKRNGVDFQELVQKKKLVYHLV